MIRSNRPNKCKHCRQRMPEDKARHVLHEDCVDPWLEAQKVKKERAAAAKQMAERKVIKTRLAELEPIAKLEKRAEAAVNSYVRARDWDKGCISCDRPASWDGQWHASHFRSVGAASAVRFNLKNIHKACSICNHHLSGNIAAYEPRLIALRGQECVDWLKSQNQVVRYSREYLERLRAVFAKKTRRAHARLMA